jgi:hypothetical protein
MRGDTNQISIGEAGPSFPEQIQRFLIKKTHAGATHNLQAGVVENFDLILIQVSATAGTVGS